MTSVNAARCLNWQVALADAGELKTRAELGITSINLAYSNVNYQLAGNSVLQQGREVSCNGMYSHGRTE